MDVNLPDGNGLEAAGGLAVDGYTPAIVLVSTLDAGRSATSRLPRRAASCPKPNSPRPNS